MNELPLTDGYIYLRSLQLDDESMMAEYAKDPDMDDTHWLPLPYLASPDKVGHVFGQLQRGWQGTEGLAVVIAEPQTTLLIGLITASLRHRGISAEIAYGIAPQWRGQGRATHSMRCFIPWVMRTYHLPHLETHIGLTNIASQRVAEQNGFVRTRIVTHRIPATRETYQSFLYDLWGD